MDLKIYIPPALYTCTLLTHWVHQTSHQPSLCNPSQIGGMMGQPESSVLNSLDGKLYDHEMEQTRIYNECFTESGKEREPFFCCIVNICRSTTLWFYKRIFPSYLDILKWIYFWKRSLKAQGKSRKQWISALHHWEDSSVSVLELFDWDKSPAPETGRHFLSKGRVTAV